jgi:fructosamine-3-kinase
MPLSRPATAATIPASILGAVLHALHEHGDTTPIQRVQPVKGGYESTSVRLTTRRRHYFLKWAPAGAQGGFQAEAAHLSLLAATGAVTVPAVLRAVDPPERADAGMQTPAGGALGFLLMEWLTPPSREIVQHRVGRELGTAVARMHAAQVIGEVPIGGYGPAAAIHDATAWRADWVAHYRDELPGTQRFCHWGHRARRRR